MTSMLPEQASFVGSFGAMSLSDFQCFGATATGADLVVFSEAFVDGYLRGLDYGARLGLRGTEGGEDFCPYSESAIDLPGPEASRLGEIARDNGSNSWSDVIERTAEPSTARR